jgi:probable phosphoglycerate mutase
MRLYIIRHADPDYPNNTITARGHLEAQALARRMAKAGLSRIYSSPLGRARDTARYTTELTGLEPQILPWTAELSMDYIADVDGAPTAAWNIAGEVVRAADARRDRADWHLLEALAGYDYRTRQRELADASDAFMADLGYRRIDGVYEVERATDEAVAVFCHAGFGVSWLAHLLELPLTLAWCGLFWAPTSVTTLVMERRSPGLAVPRALAIGDTSHIYAEGLGESSRGLPASL